MTQDRRQFLQTGLGAVVASAFAPALAIAQARGIRMDDPDVTRMTLGIVQSNFTNAGLGGARVGFGGDIDRFRSSASPLVVRNATATSTAVGQIPAMWQGIVGTLSSGVEVLEGLEGAFEQITAVVERLGRVLERLAAIGERFAKAIVAIANAISSLINSFGSIIGAIGKVIESVAGVVRTVVDAIGGILRRIFGGTDSGGSNVIGIDLDGDGEIDMGDLITPIFGFLRDTMQSLDIRNVNYREWSFSVELMANGMSFGSRTEVQVRGTSTSSAILLAA